MYADQGAFCAPLYARLEDVASFLRPLEILRWLAQCGTDLPAPQSSFSTLRVIAEPGVKPET